MSTSIVRLALALGLAASLALSLGGCGDQGLPDPDPTPTAEPPSVALSAVHPAVGGPEGGTRLRLRGSGFLEDEAGTLSVTIGGVAATDVVVVDDVQVTCVAPAGLPGTAAVRVQNENGTDTLPDAFRYEVLFLYAADGKAGVPGMLYRIDPRDGAQAVIGPVGYAVTGLALGPAGTLWATEATRRGVLRDSRLLRIDRTTGAGSVVGVLRDAGDAFVHQAVSDITFFGDRLIGWSQDEDVPVEIDPGTGRVTVIGGSVSAFGAGLASDGTGTVWLAPQGGTGPLYRVELATGVVEVGPTLAGGTIPFSSVAALAYNADTLYAVDNDARSDAGSEADLLAIDVATGDVRRVGSLPSGTDALATGQR